MNTRERLHKLIEELPEPMAVELARYAGYLQTVMESEDWHRLSAQGSGRAYGQDEPDYESAGARRVTQK